MPNITELTGNLTRIDLVPKGLTGFERFITSYVYRNKHTFLVDIGPASTAPDLLLALKNMGVDQVDYILLTHIHLDHAGATGHIAKAFPKAKIVCHPKGIRHLHDPQKLWQSSLGVLKNFAVAYQEPVSASLEQLISADGFSLSGLQIIATPGHAPHHLSYAFNDCLFIGEAAGVFFNLGDGYQRPATPPVFVLEQALASLKTLEQLRPGFTVFAHYGASDNGLEQVVRAQRQLELWADTAKHVMLENGFSIENCIEELLQLDPHVRNFNMFNAVEQKRERDFFVNALLGISGWLKAGNI